MYSVAERVPFFGIRRCRVNARFEESSSHGFKVSGDVEFVCIVELPVVTIESENW
jgi:hypothetical protein